MRFFWWGNKWTVLLVMYTGKHINLLIKKILVIPCSIKVWNFKVSFLTLSKRTIGCQDNPNFSKDFFTDGSELPLGDAFASLVNVAGIFPLAVLKEMEVPSGHTGFLASSLDSLLTCKGLFKPTISYDLLPVQPWNNTEFCIAVILRYWEPNQCYPSISLLLFQGSTCLVLCIFLPCSSTNPSAWGSVAVAYEGGEGSKELHIHPPASAFRKGMHAVREACPGVLGSDHPGVASDGRIVG